MRLINTTTFERKELYEIEANPVQYAILSHRWLSKGELTYNNFAVKQLQIGEHSPALDKIRGACKQAAAQSLDWIWIDNVCIDKSSSAELSESINSMFQWYREAEVCFAHLADTSSSLYRKSGEPADLFRRGWALQELLAPRQVEFFDREWKSLGSRRALAQEIEHASGVQACYLDGTKRFLDASIATRLSWQAPRQTTRVEDMAYSLLGVLGVSLDARYGEGRKAFMRLQEELVNNLSVSDESLFAWTMPKAGFPAHSRPDWAEDEWGLLAPGPECFRDSGDITTGRQFIPRPTNGIVKTGDGIVLPVMPREMRVTTRAILPLHFILPFSPVIIGSIRHNHINERTISLNCRRVDEKGEPRVVQICLLRDGKGDQFWRRAHCSQLGLEGNMSRNNHISRRPISVSLTILQPSGVDWHDSS